jgi:hypothetical protein
MEVPKAQILVTFTAKKSTSCSADPSTSMSEGIDMLAFLDIVIFQWDYIGMKGKQIERNAMIQELCYYSFWF